MRQKKLINFDIFLFLLVLAASLYGIVAIYSATRSFGTNSNVIIQLASMLMGTGAMLAITFFDYEQLEVFLKPVAGACIFLLILVLIIGKSGNWGAQSWIRIGPIGIQPSEIAKIGFILTFGYHLSKVNVNEPKNIFFLILHLVVPIALIMLQPDAGSAMVFVFIFMLMIFAAGISFKYIIPAITLGLVSLPLIYQFLLSDYQKHRILVFLNPELDKLGSGYNVIQSKISVGSGGFFGKGYLMGTQNQLGFLPTKHTDFIFSVISEELGFIGAGLVIILLFAIIFRCLKTAGNAQTSFGKYICTGVSAMLIFHTVENIGMCMGMLPVTGIPLPFFSYGGTSLITNFIAIGLVMSVSIHSIKRKF
ncbi:MAG: rod shape-determining protein RodA [Clostridia bacterium]|nr:rod shape-determining protein RodA [Clostridia bacterium]